MIMPKVSFRIEPLFLESLRKIAEREQMKLSEVIRQAVIEFLCEHAEDE